MMPDQTVRLVVLLCVGGAFLVLLLGSLLTPVGGLWRDGDRSITLRQLGPFVWGRCPRKGGHEEYRGWALFNVVRLERCAFGSAYLRDNGFSAPQQPFVTGQILARFVFRRRPDALVGTFQGRRFTFVERPRTRVDQVTLMPAEPRAWYRADD